MEEQWLIDLRNFVCDEPNPSEFIDSYWRCPEGHMEGFVFTDEMRRKMSVAAKKREPNFLGKTHTKEVRNKLSKLYKGKPFPGKHNSSAGTRWWNDGQINKRSVECPGKEFIPGRIPLGPYNRG
jgi:hypothetical protein